MKLKFAISLSTSVIVTLILFSCTQKDLPYRTTGLGAGSPTCVEALLVSEISYESNGYDETVSGDNPPERLSRIGCHISRYKVPGGAAWLAESGRGNIHKDEVDEYALSFVEMPENGRNLLRPQQLTDLLSSFEQNKQDGRKNIVMVYVHGWRHDAAPGNGNVIRFRTILGYTRSALNARCIETGEYCDAALTGVYLSWRGRSFNEPVSANAAAPWLTGALWTNWGRKTQSERLAKPTVQDNGDDKCKDPTYGARENSSIVGSVLRSIERNLDLEHGNSENEKMLVMGHSYGGNMLAHYLRPTAVDQIECHTIGAEMDPILGDLVVLLNPASEAYNWTKIQYTMRVHAGIPDNVYNVSSTKGLPKAIADAVKRWKGMFARTQRPFYVALTATGDWGIVENGKPNPDNATRLVFPISRHVVGQTRREQRNAIGHLLPEYASGPGRLRLAGPPVGASHEFMVNKGIGRKTEYINSGSPSLSTCGSHNGWLYKAQERQREEYDEGWDSDRNLPALLNNMGKDAELQIRNYLQPTGNRFAHSVAQGRSPFWNMRAWQTAVYDHSGFINYVTLCGINLLWLDDATAGAN